jgi:hypothetical protein
MMSKDPEDVRWLIFAWIISAAVFVVILFAVESVLITGRRYFYRHAIPKSPRKGDLWNPASLVGTRHTYLTALAAFV